LNNCVERYSETSLNLLKTIAFLDVIDASNPISAHCCSRIK